MCPHFTKYPKTNAWTIVTKKINKYAQLQKLAHSPSYTAPQLEEYLGKLNVLFCLFTLSWFIINLYSKKPPNCSNFANTQTFNIQTKSRFVTYDSHPPPPPKNPVGIELFTVKFMCSKWALILFWFNGQGDAICYIRI